MEVILSRVSYPTSPLSLSLLLDRHFQSNLEVHVYTRTLPVDERTRAGAWSERGAMPHSDKVGYRQLN